jgi:hypothetical protein
MLEWMREHPGPIYTSRTHPDYPGLVEYPLEDVINELGFSYFNSTAAYAVALRSSGVKKISLFGIDYTYPTRTTPRRAAPASSSGSASPRRAASSSASRASSLMDACAPEASSTATTRST